MIFVRALFCCFLQGVFFDKSFKKTRFSITKQRNRTITVSIFCKVLRGGRLWDLVVFVFLLREFVCRGAVGFGI